jgi:hypothetical protein
VHPGSTQIAFALGAVIPVVIGAFLAIPHFLRDRVSANESMALSTVWSVVAAQAAYQSANCGAYGPLECLVTPTGPGCIARYPATARPFLDASLLSVRGYSTVFHPGKPAGLAGLPERGQGMSGFQSYAYSAVPALQNLTGVHHFCADSTGRICVSKTLMGRWPVENGQCGEWCEPLALTPLR